MTSWENTEKSCADISCVTAGDTQAATYFTDFASTLHGTSMPAAAVGPANQLYSDATTIAGDLTTLSQATSTAQYQSAVTSTGLQQELDQFDSDDSALRDANNSADRPLVASARRGSMA